MTENVLTENLYRDELQEAIGAARLAGSFALAEYHEFVVIPDAPVSISTHVDKGCQERILAHLLTAFPNDGVWAEEGSPAARQPGTSGRVWVIDPIDGTRGFARKTGEFSVMIGLTVAGQPVVGVVAEPVRQRVTYATLGGGCWVEVGQGPPQRCRVSTTESLEAAALVQSHTAPGKPPKPVVVSLRPGRVLETYSAGVKLGMVARGEADLYANDHRGFHDWDVCAGHILVTEAGGRVSLFDDSPVTYHGDQPERRGLVATNGRIHAEAVQRLQTITERDF